MWPPPSSAIHGADLGFALFGCTQIAKADPATRIRRRDWAVAGIAMVIGVVDRERSDWIRWRDGSAARGILFAFYNIGGHSILRPLTIDGRSCSYTTLSASLFWIVVNPRGR